MTDITETSQTVAAGQLRAFVDRILRLKEEQDTIGDDIKEVYAELKGCGFDRTAVGALVTELRKKSKDSAAFEERNTILDLYRSAYEEATRPQAHARARTREIIEEFPPHDTETGEIIDQNSSDLTSSPETTDTAGAELPPSAPATNSDSVAVPAPQAQPATKEAGAEPPLAAAADNPEMPGRACTVVADGQPSTPSPEAVRAKNDGPQTAIIGQGVRQNNSGQAVTISDADVPAFLKKPPSPAPNPDCQKPQSCRWTHSQASCAKCANDAAVARQKGRAA
ncbi:DUF2312 domain-containing protein [Mesorhizobium australicum]|uniref:DUF2312 domain-containing protein n=1 Tax=Mesorhizobium australicum TaxID=536018 RepID=UPI0033350C12